MMLCRDGGNKDICDLTHDGAMCGVVRADTTRAMVIQKRDKTSNNGYQALVALDEYKGCLENAVLAQSERNRSNEISRFEAIQNIPDYQNKIISETKGARPEINLWLYKETGDDIHWESMLNGVPLAKDIHPDVYTYMIAEATNRDIEEAKKLADTLLYKNKLISDLPADLYSFYTLYYLKKNNIFKSAVWQGLYAQFVQNKTSINHEYFERYEKTNLREIKKAQAVVDDLIFDMNWKGMEIADIPKSMI